MLRNKTAILGIGITGKAILRYLLQQGEIPLLFDKNVDALKNEDKLAVFTIYSENDVAQLAHVERIIVSPGIPADHPLLKEALQRNIVLTSEMEIALSSLRQEPVVLFAITGSCGKTTTTSLVTHVLQASGKKARSYGNIGYPLINYWIDKHEYLVVEVSSYQLERIQHPMSSFDAAVIINITPNHLDHHASLEEYVKAKMSLANLLKETASFFITAKIKEEFEKYLPTTRPLSYFDQENVATIFSTSYRNRGFGEFAGDAENSKAAYVLCREAGISKKDFLAYAESFKKPEHRFEFVRNVNGVAYVNDSKATTIPAVIEAIKAVHMPVILIAGGMDKGMDFSPWKEALKGKVSLVLLIGKASALLAKLLGEHLPVREIGTLEDAVKAAFLFAKEGECVLLSPGCASFDQFVDYQQRGKRFKELVLKLEGSS